MYYTAKVKLLVSDAGAKKEKWATEQYLVRAESVTHAEQLVAEDFAGESIDFEVKGVTQSQIVKIINP
jgi:hypothetical protein